ncbi:diacylglycerol/lipid kinase family protein [Roseospira goensis]|uniref:Diacylglycerol kinase family enzyme n=1 Tax=Roseospira goensis TaxID=391922 RepID=A0A7W6RZ42_9PROT|nr:diacylglycerol kinase family protein [Roseospira goensis]MBB4285716.1 diacylglycerol kinase family enzyme [Roseospira goensis]
MRDDAAARGRVVVLVNSAAGAFVGDAQAPRALADRLVVGLIAQGLRATARLADGEAMAGVARQVVADGAAALVVAGGDGTLAAVATALCDPKAPAQVPMAAVPLGTANLLARDLRMPDDPEAAAAALADGVVGRIDVGRVNGRVFLNSVILGLFANVARQRERFRGAMTPLLWVRLLWRLVLAMRRYPRLRAVLATENGVHRVKTHAMVVADNAYAERPGLLVRRDSLGHGALAIYVMRHRTPWRLLRLGMGLMMLGQWRRDADLLTEDARRLTVAVRRRVLRAAVDGEVVLLPRRVSFRLDPAALPVWVPAEAAPVLARVDGPARALLAAAGDGTT